MKAFGIIEDLITLACAAWGTVYLCRNVSPYVWASLLAAKIALLLIALATKGKYRWPALLFAPLALTQTGLVVWFLIKHDAGSDMAVYAAFGLLLAYGVTYCYMDRVFLYRENYLGMSFHEGKWVHRIGKPPEHPVAHFDPHAPITFRESKAP